MDVEHIMFSIIRSEIFGHEVKSPFEEELPEDIYKKLYLLSAKHDLAHIAASALSKAGRLGDDEISRQFRKQLMLSVYRAEQQGYALEQTSEILSKAEIPHIPLKGSVIRKLYPEPWMRTSCDIDVLVHPEDLDGAMQALCSGGFVHLQDSAEHDYSLAAPNDVHLELHFVLMTHGYWAAADKLLGTVWEYAVPDKRGHNCYCMANEMFMFYHIAHMAKHFVHGGCGIRPLIDLQLLREKMPCDMDKLNDMLNEATLAEFYQSAFVLCGVWFEDSSHTERTREMEQYILSGGVYGTASNAAMIKAAKGERTSETFLKLMFLPRKNLEIIYPRLKKYPALFPFYQMKRWLRIFDSKKRKKVQHLTAARNAVTQNEANSAKALLEDLGLTK